MEDQEFGDARGRDGGRVQFLEGFEAAARLEYCLPLDGIDRAADLFALRQEDVVFQVEDTGCGVGAFEEFSDLHEVPAFALGEGGVCGAGELVGIIDDLPVEVNGALFVEITRVVGSDPEVQAVDPLPHFA